jgi:hypothetical protein
MENKNIKRWKVLEPQPNFGDNHSLRICSKQVKKVNRKSDDCYQSAICHIFEVSRFGHSTWRQATRER